MSSYFIDMSKVTYHSSGLELIANEVVHSLCGPPFISNLPTVMGGPVLGAAPIVGGAIARYKQWSLKRTFLPATMRGFWSGKNQKDGQYIEGDLRSGDKVLVVEDVVTTGKQVRTAIERIVEVGAEVVGIIAVVDRLAGASEALKDWPYKALVTIEDLGIKP
jgi:orotate phosphoribosyltransferase